MFTVITKGNVVTKRERIFYGDIDDIIIVDEYGKVKLNKGNPITWPTAPTTGMQAIVDINKKTLRFAYDGWPRSHGEYVVSEYVEPVKVKDCDLSTMNQLLDLITEWPETTPHVIPTGNKLFEHGAIFHDKYVEIGTEFKSLTTSILKRDWFNYHENKNKKAAAAPKTTITAASMLTAALGHMEDRAKTYDAPGGERSMGKTVAAFNAITGLGLTEEQGWLFMEILKQVRSQQGNYRADNYEDMVAYAALRGECAARERGSKP